MLKKIIVADKDKGSKIDQHDLQFAILGNKIKEEKFSGRITISFASGLMTGARMDISYSELDCPISKQLQIIFDRDNINHKNAAKVANL